MRIRDLILPEDRVFFTLFKDMAGKISEAAQSSTRSPMSYRVARKKGTKSASWNTLLTR